MPKSKKRVSTLALWTLILCLSSTATASLQTDIQSYDLINSVCPTGLEQSRAFNKLRTDIVTAETLEQARVMALKPTEDAMNALDNAYSFLPFSDDLAEAKYRLNAARTRILAASSQQQVADELSGLMLAGLDDNAATLNVGKTGCHYTNGEVVAIVIGLILGIIPGLILLVLLC
ncbi:hypothetical protein [Methylomonas sp. AM2-LC]|uniref:hypothetical protein n=1 Tax=Methylomonas sp. AM2-LC TaxID=3153301 RepID=UPI0032674283